MNEDRALAELSRERNSRNLTWLYTCKFMLGVYMNDLSSAKEADGLTKKLRRLLRGGGILSDQHFAFYEGLVCCQLAHFSKAPRRRRLRIRVENCLKRLRSVAVVNPANFQNKMFLLEAEFASLDCHANIFLPLYEKSIECAATEGLLHEQALACEKAAFSILREKPDLSNARPYIERARDLFEKWGAVVKLDRLDKLLQEGSAVQEKDRSDM